MHSAEAEVDVDQLVKEGQEEEATQGTGYTTPAAEAPDETEKLEGDVRWWGPEGHP